MQTKTIMLARSIHLRKYGTETEGYLWSFLRAKRLHGYKFKRQVIIGYYIVDFICFEKRLIIEVDGGQHAEAHAYDERRTAFLAQQGFKVLRFWSNEVFEETNSVLDTILRHLTPSP